jgi:hypothetical protein
MQLKEIEKLTKKQLRQRIDDEFALADEKGPAYLAKAQFYMRELEHRHDSWISLRDLILEIVVILLIGGEIILGYCQGRDAAKASALEQQVLTNLQKSSAATVSTLQSLQKTTEEMNKNIGTEVGLNYDVAVEVTFDNQVKHVNISNKGRTNVYVWGDKLDQQKPLIDTKGKMIAPGGSYYIIADTFYEELGTKLPKGSQRLVPFSVFLKNENGDEFIVECQFFAVWYLDNLTIHTQTTSVRRAHWSGKDK